MTGVRGYIYAKCGHIAEARAVLDRLLAEARTGKFVPRYGLAVIYAGLGNNSQALAELDAIDQNREWVPSMLKVEPAFERVRADPRFTELVTKVRLMSLPRVSLTR